MEQLPHVPPFLTGHCGSAAKKNRPGWPRPRRPGPPHFHAESRRGRTGKLQIQRRTPAPTDPPKPHLAPLSPVSLYYPFSPLPFPLSLSGPWQVRVRDQGISGRGEIRFYARYWVRRILLDIALGGCARSSFACPTKCQNRFPFTWGVAASPSPIGITLLGAPSSRNPPMAANANCLSPLPIRPNMRRNLRGTPAMSSRPWVTADSRLFRFCASAASSEQEIAPNAPGEVAQFLGCTRPVPGTHRTGPNNHQRHPRFSDSPEI